MANYFLSFLDSLMKYSMKNSAPHNNPLGWKDPRKEEYIKVTDLIRHSDIKHKTKFRAKRCNDYKCNYKTSYSKSESFAPNTG